MPGTTNCRFSHSLSLNPAFIAMYDTLRTLFLHLLRWAKGCANRILLLLSWVMRSLGLDRRSGASRDQPDRRLRQQNTAIGGAFILHTV